MIEAIETTNYILALLGIASFLFALILIVDLYTSRTFENHIKKCGLWAAFSLVLIASVMAMVYSDVFGLIPCGLCWFQRVFLFSQLFILGTALYYRDTLVSRYGIVLSVAGLTVSLYQHYLQSGGTSLVRCPVAGTGSDCTARFFYEFGFMTFPLLSASIFVLLIAIYFYHGKVKAI